MRYPEWRKGAEHLLQRTGEEIRATADIIATPANPLENVQALRQLKFVLKNGKVVRHTE